MKQMWVYILECADGSYYTGVTIDIERRFYEHQHGTHIGYTNARQPVKLVFAQEFDNPIEAIDRERQIKRWSHWKKKALIESDYLKLVELSKSKSLSNCKIEAVGHGSTSSP